jgi:hypothetical protein
MEAALKGVPVKEFPPPAYGGEITNRAPVVITTTQPAPPTETPPTEVAQPPDPTETSDEPDPTDSEPDPSATRPIFPTIDPTDPDDGDGDGDGNGNGGGNNNDNR